MTRSLLDGKTLTDHWQHITEPEFQGQVLQHAWGLGWRLQYHTYSSRRSSWGWPDLVLVRDGRILFVELKTEKSQPTAEQCEWLEALAGCGVEVYLWRPSDEDERNRVLS